MRHAIGAVFTFVLRIPRKRRRSCGCVVLLAVTTDGKLLTVGSNSKKGLLGLGVVDGRDRSRLTEVPALKGVDVVSVACG